MKKVHNSAPLQIYRASAGSGKTFNLALQYIILLLGRFDEQGRYRLIDAEAPRRHGEILAITFTNKATQEMKQRIIDELKSLANTPADSKYKKQLLGLVKTGQPNLTDDEILTRLASAAKSALASLLFNYSDMNVSTIDKFFQRVLRSFAYEADLSGNYDLMLENNLLTNQSIDTMLAIACGLGGVVVPKDVNVNALRSKVVDLIADAASRGKNYMIFSPTSSMRETLVHFNNDLTGEDYHQHSQEILQFLADDGVITRLRGELKAKREELEGKVGACYNELLAIAGDQKNGNTFKTIITLAKLKDISPSAQGYLNGSKSTDELFKKTAPISVKEQFAESFEVFADVCRKAVTVDQMLANLPNLTLFDEIQKAERYVKASTNTILLSDTNGLLSRIIDDSEAPFIYERIGQQLRHFLIDEFQDTSRMQWHNLLPLVIESMSELRQNMVIGDVKQCIYRFRNSDPQLLAGIANEGKLAHMRDHMANVPLSENYRSSATVVDFNNRFFVQVGADPVTTDTAKLAAYTADVKQAIINKEMPGYVDILLAPEEELNAYERMATHMKRQLAAGYPPSEIVALTRTNTEAKRVVEYLLTQTVEGALLEGQSIISDEALQVGSSQAVKWLVGKLRQLDLADVSLTKKINKTTGLPEATVYDIDRMLEIIDRISGEGAEMPVEKMIEEFNQLRATNTDELSAEQELRIMANGLSLYEAVEELVRKFPNKNWAATDAQYIAAFQDLVYDYCLQKSPTLHGFLRLWDERLEKSAAVGLAEGTEAIRVMTIHKSKGLEFGAVHLPEVSRALNDMKGLKWFPSAQVAAELGLTTLPPFLPLQLQSGNKLSISLFAEDFAQVEDDAIVDEINTLYVAFTRARQELIVSVPQPKKEDNLLAPAAFMRRMLAAVDSNQAGSWVFGKPTRYAGSVQAVDPTRMELNEYPTCERKDVWARTVVAAEDDQGTLI